MKILRQLKVLDLSHNHLNSNFMLETNVNLEILNLRNNSITDLYIFHNHLPRHLKMLDLSFNHVQRVIGKNFEALYTDSLIMNLTHNQIQTIQLEDFGKYNLLDSLSVTVDLNHNPLKCVCDLWSMMTYSKVMNKYLRFYTNNLKCFEPKRLKGKFFQDLKETELLCPVELKYKDFQECPAQCECWLKIYDSTLIIDCSGKNLTEIPNIANLKRNYSFRQVEFNLSMNFIQQLPTWPIGDDYSYSTELILNKNNLTRINKNQIPHNVTLLDVRENQLEYLDQETLHFMNSSVVLKQIKLTDNKWLCNCSQTSWALYYFTQRNTEKFKDALQMTCSNSNSPMEYVHDIPNLCTSNDILYIVIGSTVAFIFLLLVFYYKYQIEIKIWLYGHNACLCLVAETDSDSEAFLFKKKYDAFVSYSHKDKIFVTDYLVPELENVIPKFKLCIHTRDFIVGDYIVDQIVRCIAESKRVIVVLSKNYVQSEWSKLEFKEAFRATLEERKTKIIVIMYEDIGDISDYDRDFEMYLKMNTYLKWGDPQFWQKLRYVMPHKIN